MGQVSGWLVLLCLMSDTTDDHTCISYVQSEHVWLSSLSEILQIQKDMSYLL